MSTCLPLQKVLLEEYEHLHGKVTPAPTNLDEVVALLHEKERAALCISGGGIRSASFALGVIQGLARLGERPADSVLNKIDYLSTVSGGGYLGSWLSAWATRQGSMEAVVGELRNKPADKLRPEPAPVRHLRTQSNYMTPELGLLSADTWSFFGAYLRNLILTWLVLIPFVIGILAVPRLFVALAVNQLHIPYEVFHYATVILFYWSFAFIGFTRPTRKPTPDKWIYSNPGFQVCCLLPLCLFAVAIVIDHSEHPLNTWKDGQLKMIALAVVGTVLSSLIYTVRKLRAEGPGVVTKQIVELVVSVVSGVIFAVLLYQFLIRFDSPLVPMPEPNPLAWLKGNVPLLSSSMAAAYIVFGVPLVILALLLQATIFVGGTGRRNDDFDREWWGRAAAWLIVGGLVWLLVTSITIYGPIGIYYLLDRSLAVSAIGGISALAAIVKFLSPAESRKRKKQSPLRQSFNVALGFAVPVAAIGLLAACVVGVTLLVNGVLLRSLLQERRIIEPTTAQQRRDIALLKQTSWTFEQKQSKAGGPLGVGEQKFKTASYPALESYKLEGLAHLRVMEQTPLTVAMWLLVGPIALSLLASFLIEVNRFSTHALLRNRLVRAYLGASNPDRKPSPFTGFDPNDNIPISALLRRPMHVVNMCLNLTGGGNLAWRRRDESSFTASPLHCGSLNLGYRPSTEYGGPRGMKLGTAAAISGVAANANIGYHASPALGLLLAFFNLRLGWWLGSPLDDTTYHLGHPRTSLKPLLSEASGSTSLANQYVYLSDGRHFESLGLYEMVLRRCGRIILIGDRPAEKTPVLDDLTKSMLQINIDLGLRVVVDRSEKNLVTGRILYSEIDRDARDGQFIYIAPVVYGTEYESVDQLSSDLQFEIYRLLGLRMIDDICHRMEARVNSVDEFFEIVDLYLNPAAPAPTPVPVPSL